MDTNAIIDILGGSAKTAKICRVSRAAVSLWKHRGIPPPRWETLIDHAKAKGIDGLTFVALQAAHRTHKEEKRT